MNQFWEKWVTNEWTDRWTDPVARGGGPILTLIGPYLKYFALTKVYCTCRLRQKCFWQNIFMYGPKSYIMQNIRWKNIAQHNFKYRGNHGNLRPNPAELSNGVDGLNPYPNLGLVPPPPPPQFSTIREFKFKVTSCKILDEMHQFLISGQLLEHEFKSANGMQISHQPNSQFGLEYSKVFKHAICQMKIKSSEFRTRSHFEGRCDHTLKRTTYNQRDILPHGDWWGTYQTKHEDGKETNHQANRKNILVMNKVKWSSIY